MVAMLSYLPRVGGAQVPLQGSRARGAQGHPRHARERRLAGSVVRRGTDGWPPRSRETGKEFVVSPVLAKVTGVAVYLAFITGLGALCATLSRHAGMQALTLVAPLAAPLFVANVDERPLTLVERRQVEAGPAVADAGPAISAHEAIVLEAPATPLPVLVAKMDLAEQADLLTGHPKVRRAGRSRARHVARPARVAAADVFGRSFGVLLTATQ